MDKCPQCNTDRPQDEQGQYLAFCDECGHKFAASSKPQTQPQTQPDEPGWRGNQSKAFDEYEKDYVARVVGDETDTDESDVSESPEIQGSAILMPDGQPIYFEDDPKVVGRSDVSAYLKSVGKDPLQVSRKQFTIFKESYFMYFSTYKIINLFSVKKTIHEISFIFLFTSLIPLNSFPMYFCILN